MKLLQSFLNRVYPPVSFTADISARPRIRPADIPSVLIAVLIGLLLTVFGTFDLLLSFIMGELWTVFSSLILIALGAALLIFEHALILVSYKKTVKAIKKELGVTESDAVSMK